MPATLPRLAFGEARASREGGINGLLAAQQAAHRLVPLARGGFSFAPVLRRICSVIDSSLDRPDQLALLGVEDLIYRAVAMLVLPEQPTAASGDPSVAGQAPLDRACEHIVDHLSGPIRLADLERVSGLKTRALQLAFLDRFGRTPPRSTAPCTAPAGPADVRCDAKGASHQF